MAKKKWVTELADRIQGEKPEDKALLDIAVGIRLNLYHDSVGIHNSATPKNLVGIESYVNVGSVAFDRIKNLTWENYGKIARGEAVLTPQVGSIDTIQFPLNTKISNSLELMETDLEALKKSGQAIAMMANTMVKSLAAGLDI